MSDRDYKKRLLVRRKDRKRLKELKECEDVKEESGTQTPTYDDVIGVLLSRDFEDRIREDPSIVHIDLVDNYEPVNNLAEGSIRQFEVVKAALDNYMEEKNE